MRVRIPALVALVVLVPSAPAFASNGGTGVPDTSSGGVVYGQVVRAIPAPAVLRRFALDPRRLLVRVDQNGADRVRVRVLLRRARTSRVLGRTIATGQPVTIALPRLSPGRWDVVLQVTDSARVQRGRFVVRAPRRPKTRPVVAAPAPPPPADGGVFPVAGPHSYGDGIGVARNGHRHQGQDVIAAQGTPVVAPVAGTVLYTGLQKAGAGYYVVEQASDGRAFFFAHCSTGSIAVSPGEPVPAGHQLCRVGHSGDASGPHLHFEIWLGGWRVDKNSHFIDPLPTLRAWDRG